jgi:hypothetical protein
VASLLLKQWWGWEGSRPALHRLHAVAAGRLTLGPCDTCMLPCSASLAPVITWSLYWSRVLSRSLPPMPVYHSSAPESASSLYQPLTITLVANYA